ncbi:Nudix hydrolase 2 [Capsicum annuum]|nr:Nudix hydrolase 2 [Capsicum annuum]
MAKEKEMEQVDRILAAKEDDYGGVTVEMTNEPLEPSVFVSLLRASLSHWRQQDSDFTSYSKAPFPRLSYCVVKKKEQTFFCVSGLLHPKCYSDLVYEKCCRMFIRQSAEHQLIQCYRSWNRRTYLQGKRGVWIKLPIKLVTLVEPAVKEGFYYHHAEPKYLMLVSWLPGTANTIPANATHRVGIGAFVLNERNEVLVVQEKSGRFRGTGVWKFPTGVVDEGEDICDAAVREVKEETGVDAKFIEILAFRQSHKSFFDKSDLFFVCMLQPLSFDIQKQDAEIEAAEWMPFEQYAAQPFVQGHDLLKYIADICSAKMEGRCEVRIFNQLKALPKGSKFHIIVGGLMEIFGKVHDPPPNTIANHSPNASLAWIFQACTIRVELVVVHHGGLPFNIEWLIGVPVIPFGSQFRLSFMPVIGHRDIHDDPMGTITFKKEIGPEIFGYGAVEEDIRDILSMEVAENATLGDRKTPLGE